MLTEQFTADSVNVVMAHATLLGGRRGGGERDVQTSFEYEVPSNIFPSSAHYAALGHLHRQQEIPAPCPAFYSGSPLAVDFGEEANEPGVLLVTASPASAPTPGGCPSPAAARCGPCAARSTRSSPRASRPVTLTCGSSWPSRLGPGSATWSGRSCQTHSRSSWTKRTGPGLARTAAARPSRAGRTPVQLFGDYLAEQNVADERVERMFAGLLEEMTDAPPGSNSATAPLGRADTDQVPQTGGMPAYVGGFRQTGAVRPLRLLLDGFGTYRNETEIDFADVDFFALVGPTGSGKSTVIDALCFALYGTVPRWDNEKEVRNALAPSANACRVSLIFELAGQRYVAARSLQRDKRGKVSTKAARLERLDASVPPDAPLTEMLEASVEQLAEGPDNVKARVQELLGLSYEHFTQSVLLPQGGFSDFLRATPANRQRLLVELLAFGVYKEIGQRARERAAARRGPAATIAQQARGQLADASDRGSESAAAARLADLTAAGRRGPKPAWPTLAGLHSRPTPRPASPPGTGTRPH